MRPRTHRLPLRAALAGALLLLASCDRDPTGPALRPDAGARGDVAAAAFNGRIRIGVVPSASSVAIGSDAGYTITEKTTGNVLFTGTAGAATVTLESVVYSWYRLQVVCGSTASVEARRAAAEADGVPTFTEFVPAANCTRLFLGRFPANASFTIRNNFRNEMIAAGHSGTDSFWAVKADPGVTEYRVTRGAESTTSSGPVVLTSSDGIVTIAGVKYRDMAEVRVNGAGTLAGINELPMEQYLYGVVPQELGPVAFPELEALKAQAVAARTYALAGLGKRASDGYDLLATTTDQVYGGYAAEHPLSSRAVDETAGVAATYAGGLINALYSSTSGGHTADSEEAFAAAVSYLRGIPDAERGQALEHVPSVEVFRAHGNPASLRATREGDFDSNWGRFHRWTFRWTAAEISSVISAYAGQPVGKVLAINVTERGPSGRVLAIEYVTEAGVFTDTKDRIRASLKYINASGTPTNLLSTLFFVEPTSDGGFRVYGGGFGHGVGLSQTGAVGMAEKGHTFDRILKYYYRDIDLVKWY
ncbi:MAG TPA: SpoIID/LytB domain-containing protein [Longimicrobiaceae bacterium]|nr:SpoIID/LytB domain-containing protein [Longimicrobiaceae bacterium]